tara:strand:+ start:29400 stop:30230 length:831 start_codon:yes stop_codon:yes gene_type:complete
MNIIGLGTTGCEIAKKITEQNKEVYKTYLIDTIKYKNFKSKVIEEQSRPEAYEQEYKTCKRFLTGLLDSTLLVLSGQDLVTSCVLRLVEEIRNRTKITVLYVMPDIEMLPKVPSMHERMIRGVLQQYARSGLMERMYLVSVSNMSEIVGPVPLSEYKSSLYDTISYYFHMLNYYNNSTPVMSNNSISIDAARISTLGVFDLETKQEKMFFNLQFPREVLYCYGVSKETLETDVQLYKSIKDHVKESEIESVNYKIFQLTSDSNCGIVVKHASYIQE